MSGTLNVAALSDTVSEALPTQAPSLRSCERWASVPALEASQSTNKQRPTTTNAKAPVQCCGVGALALHSIAANHLSSSWQPCEMKRRLADVYEFVRRTAGVAVSSPSEFSADYTCILSDKLLQHYLTERVEHLADFLEHLSGPVELTIRLVMLVNTRLNMSIGPYYACTPLGYAILRDDVRLAETLLKHGADPVAAPCIPSLPVTTDIRSSMHLALSRHTSPQLVDLILRDHAEAMAYINYDDFWSCFVLYLAKCKDITTMTSLLTFADDVDRADTSSCTLLQHAARTVNLVACKALVQRGADVNVSDRTRKTALMYAAEADAGDVVRFLLANGADVHATDAWGRTALHYAARKSMVATVRDLLLTGADIRMPDNRGLSPVHYAYVDANNRKLLGRAAPKDDEVVLLECLLAPRDGSVPQTPATSAPRLTATDFIDIAQLLFKSGASTSSINTLLQNNVPYVRACADDGQTILHLAARYGNATSVHWLLDHGAEVGNCDCKGWNALHCAAIGGNLDVVDQLLDQRLVDINQVTRDGWTPLWLAVRCRHTQLATRLVSAGCHVTRSMSVNKLRCELDIDIMLPASLWKNEEQEETRENIKRGRRRISLIELTIHFRMYSVSYVLHAAGARPCVVSKEDNGPSQLDFLKLFVESEMTEADRLGKVDSVEYLRLLTDALFECRCLKDTCRVAIRRALNTNICERVQDLHLPPALVSYVQLRDVSPLHGVPTDPQHQPAVWV